MNFIVLISVVAYVVLSAMAIQAVEACNRETKEIYKRCLYRQCQPVILQNFKKYFLIFFEKTRYLQSMLRQAIAHSTIGYLGGSYLKSFSLN